MNGKYQIEMVDGRFAGQLGVAEISAPVAAAKNPQTCLLSFGGFPPQQFNLSICFRSSSTYKDLSQKRVNLSIFTNFTVLVR